MSGHGGTDRRSSARRQRTIVWVGGALTALLLGGTPAAKATRATEVRFTAGSADCNVSVDHVVAGAVDVDDPLGLPPAPLVGPLLNQHQRATAGPECPARALAGGNGAASDVTLDVAARRVSIELGATSAGGSVHAEATASIAVAMVARDAGYLYVTLDHVSEAFDRSCSGCEAPPQSGYLLGITVHSASGDVSITCGTAAAPAEDATVRLPDERCALGSDGRPAQLPVGGGQLTVEITVLGFATVSGSGAAPVDGHAFTRASSHLVSFDIEPA